MSWNIWFRATYEWTGQEKVNVKDWTVQTVCVGGGRVLRVDRIVRGQVYQDIMGSKHTLITLVNWTIYFCFHPHNLSFPEMFAKKSERKVVLQQTLFKVCAWKLYLICPPPLLLRPCFIFRYIFILLRFPIKIMFLLFFIPRIMHGARYVCFNFRST